MSTFFTSDQHFSHHNILRHEDAARRGQWGQRFRDVDTMNTYITDQWNKRIQPDDLVYVLGDMSFKQSVLAEILPQLNGRKILVCGNHDPYFKRLLNPKNTKTYAEALSDAKLAGLESAHLELMIDIPEIGKVKLSHFPYFPLTPSAEKDYQLRYPNVRPKKEDEVLLLCGHVHSAWEAMRKNSPGMMLNVGVDINRLAPFSEADIAERYSFIRKA
jgi:calcineurin-like phosphoesterase family protein